MTEQGAGAALACDWGRRLQREGDPLTECPVPASLTLLVTQFNIALDFCPEHGVELGRMGVARRVPASAEAAGRHAGTAGA